jgi:hypothetical protein
MGIRLAICRTLQGAALQGAAGAAHALPHHHPLLGCGGEARQGNPRQVRCGTEEEWRGSGPALLTLASRLDRLSPSHRNPHQFHEEKSEIAHALRVLAKEDRQ